MQTHVWGGHSCPPLLTLIWFLVVPSITRSLLKKSKAKAADKSDRPTLVAGGGQILFQRDFEIHQLASLGIAHAREVKVRASQRRGNSRHIEEQESRLR